MPPGARARRASTSAHQVTARRNTATAACCRDDLAIPAALIFLALVILPRLSIASMFRRHGGQRQKIPWTGVKSPATCSTA